ncbi:hypothetical protein EWM64_g1888 [Hericium alpestre]|uniref:Uncharacterized protein n=1 Tax=Hericium alpestre TaxID=135208 RepID=A0A4Z0A778_9AGAM|nr:hypothetical protein EWM64_g1888 [Hericium alpestre]
MLLDAVLTSNLTPDLMPYMAEPAVHPHANQNPHPYDPSAFYPNAVEHEAHYSRSRSRPSPYTNGNGNGNGITNGERAWRDAHAAEHAHGPGLEYAQAETNGRAP